MQGNEYNFIDILSKNKAFLKYARVATEERVCDLSKSLSM